MTQCVFLVKWREFSHNKGKPFQVQQERLCGESTSSDKWNPLMCTQESTTQMSFFFSSDISFLMFYSGVCRISSSQCVSAFTCLAHPSSPFQLCVCPVWAWQALKGFPGRKYVVWSGQVPSSLSITQRLPDEWESNHSSPWQNCLSCIQAWSWRGMEEAPVTCNLSYKHACVSSAKKDVPKLLGIQTTSSSGAFHVCLESPKWQLYKSCRYKHYEVNTCLVNLLLWLYFGILEIFTV